MSRKMTPHIIAVTALAVFIILGLASVTTPKSPEEIVYDSSLSENQMATLFVVPGYIQVTHFNGISLNPQWFQVSSKDRGMDVRIPAGRHTIGFNFFGGQLYGGNVRNVSQEFTAIEGRNYTIFFALLSSNSRGGQILFEILESKQSREPSSNEQVLFIKVEDAFHINLILDKGTENERKIRLYGLMDNRIIVPQGDHTIDLELTQAYINDYGNNLTVVGDTVFTASSEPVRFSIKHRSSGLGLNTQVTKTITRK